MKFDSSERIFDLKGIRKKIFKIKSMYNPRLIANLSKEMHDRYIIRESACNNLLEKLEQNESNKEEIKIFIKKKIKSL